jgi:NADH-quinone oxidoreductase subunit M
MSEHILSVIVASPFLAALLIMLVPGDRHGPIRVLGFVGSVISLLGAIYVALHYDQARGGMQFGVVYPFIPRFGIDIRLAADGWSVALLLLTGIIMTAGSLASATLTNRPKEFYILLLVLVAGVFGVFVCQDLFVFFLFYEIAVLPMYLLIGIWGSKARSPPPVRCASSGGVRRRRQGVRRDEADPDAARRLGGHPRRHVRHLLRGPAARAST